MLYSLIFLQLRSEFRSLVAGAGTDGGVPYLAEQLHQTNHETVYLDFSIQSMKIAQFKATMRGSMNIIWVVDCLESIPKLGLGKFDFIGCTGVLHHLKSPLKGLKIINEAQIGHGGANLMVYGTYGRTGVYQVQKLLQTIGMRDTGLLRELEIAKSILKILPEDHSFNHLPFNEDMKMGHAGIYDLLLHKRDTSFDVAGLHKWLHEGGYDFVDYAMPGNSISLSLNAQISDTLLYRKLILIRPLVQQAVAELVSGHTLLFWLYASKQGDPVAQLTIKENAIYALGAPIGFRHVINSDNNYYQYRNQTFVVARLTRTQIEESSELYNNYSPSKPRVLAEIKWPSTEFNNYVLDTLARPPRRPETLRSLYSKYMERSKSNLTIKQATEMLLDLYSYIKGIGIFHIRHQYIPSFSLTCCVNQYSLFGKDAGSLNYIYT